MENVTPPRPKKRTGANADTTHMRVYKTTLEILHEVAAKWNTTILEAQRFLAEAALAGMISPQDETQTQ